MSTEQDLIRELREIGVDVSSIWDLVNGPNNYKAALSILISHLRSAENPKLKEGIVRALGVKGFDAASQQLIKEFKKSNDELYKWAIANTIEIISPEDQFEELVSLMKDPKHGISRQMIARALGKIGDSRCIQVLVDSLSEDDLAGHAIEALGMVGDSSVVESIRPFTKHKTKWVKTAANKAIKRIQQANK